MGEEITSFQKLVKNSSQVCNNVSVNSSCAQPPCPAPWLLQGICPPCQSWGRGICKFCAARGLGSCQPQSSDTCGFLSEYNYTEDFTGKTSRLAHLSMKRKIEEVCKGMFLILCIHSGLQLRARGRGFPPATQSMGPS